MAPPEALLEAPRAGELRGQVREWRRGRAELNYWEIFSDAYIALFAVVMIGSMAGNVVLNLRRLALDIAGLSGDHGAGRLLRGRPDVLEIPGDLSTALDIDTPSGLAGLATTA